MYAVVTAIALTSMQVLRTLPERYNEVDVVPCPGRCATAYGAASFRRIVDALASEGETLALARVLVVGVADKAGDTHVQESSAVEVINGMRDAGASVSFIDDLVGSITVRGGRMASVHAGDPSEWDAVLVHTLHPGVDHAWLSAARRVLFAAEC
ncbi:hypothetical protein COUCH_05660 [Couchioplanes caeruleus]|uniref:hypothetical protein n=1 Tax=Couchioplanes caeruleus TaxID=56438 RepID=UPI0020C08EA3|nr:hypothetical protein [Couchioplanes caeruleus]UQU65803.1 hypothetical protein COUCH_05660 [Couchioplanes caeruleus]